MVVIMSIEQQEIQEVIVCSYEQLENVFLAFETKAEHRTIFESRIWLATWYKHYWQKNWQLHCVVYYQNDILIGFAPFYVKNTVTFPYLKSLHFMGQGELEIAEVASEYLDIQIVPSYEAVIYPLITKHLNSAAFDIFNASAILENSHIMKVLQQLRGNVNKREYCRYIIECKEWSLQGISKNTRSRIKRTQNQLQKLNFDIRWLTAEEINSCWSTLVSFHQDRWKTKGRSGAFHSEEFNLFHLDLIKYHSKNISVSAIFINNKPIAINYYLKDKDTLYFYQSGWDQKNYAKLSPGLYLHYWSIENCPVTTYDFMMGGINDSYKAKFSSNKEPMVSLGLIRNKPKIFILKVINVIKKYATDH